jgi:hypothetical protein
VPIFVFTSVPTGRPLPGGLWLTLATVHSPSADGQVMHPVLLQISIEPSSDTAHPQRAPLAVLSIHMRTAVLPFVAEAGVESVTPTTATIVAKVIAAGRDIV